MKYVEKVKSHEDSMSNKGVSNRLRVSAKESTAPENLLSTLLEGFPAT